MNDTIYDGHEELYHHAEFGEGAGCRCGNMVFVCFFNYRQDCRQAAICRYCFYSVAKNQHLPPSGKKYELDPKMDDTS